MVGGDIVERVFRYRADRNAVNQHIKDPVAGIRMDGECS